MKLVMISKLTTTTTVTTTATTKETTITKHKLKIFGLLSLYFRVTFSDYSENKQNQRGTFSRTLFEVSWSLNLR